MNTRLWRVSGMALVIATGANTLLWPISREGDTFANVVAVGSGLAAAALIVTHYVDRLRRFTDTALLLTMAVWLTNDIEFALEGVKWESRVRSCAFYTVFALIALGMYLVYTTAEDERDEQ